jgi:hypothetical protein
MSNICIILVVVALVQSVTCFQLRSTTGVSRTQASLSPKASARNVQQRATTSDEEIVAVSDVRRMIDESAASLMKRFWEIDLQTQRRMDMILRLYEVLY